MNNGQREDSAFHAYYEWVEEQLHKIESEKEEEYYWETPWFSFNNNNNEESSNDWHKVQRLD